MSLFFAESLWSACFSGYRAEKFGFSLQTPNAGLQELQTALESAVQKTMGEGFTTFYCGAAEGFDILAGETILAFKERMPDLRLVCAVPFAGQQAIWSEYWQKRYEALLAGADEIEVLHPTYTKSCYHDRNRFMVDRSCRLICYYDGRSGGTAYTVRYAQKRGVDIQNLFHSLRGDNHNENR